MTAVELRWGVTGRVPEDHGYLLYSAISHRLRTEIHDDESWSVAPVRGGQLRLRCPVHLAPMFAAVMESASLRVGGETLSVEFFPRLHPLVPMRSMESSAVTIKAGMLGTCDLSSGEFEEALEGRLGALGIMVGRGIGYDLGDRREGRVKDALVVGYAVRLWGLPPAVSLRLQVEGLGGRRKMGWGWFA